MKVLVTGANRGIGLELAKQLVARGDEVIATARNPEAAEELQALATAHEGRVWIERLDVSDPASIGALAGQITGQSIDVLINNAGVYLRGGGLGDMDWSQAEKSFQINTLGPLRVSEALLPSIKQDQPGKIVNVTSQMGSIDDNGSGGAYAYRMSKTALNMGTKSLAQDLSRDGVVTFVIHPGWVQTDMGGPNAKITTTQCVEGMLSVIDNATPEHNGRFMNWDGSELPW